MPDSIKKFTDDCILSKAYSDHGLYKRINAQITLCKEAFFNGTLNPASYTGYYNYIARRVIALCQNNTSIAPAIITPSTASSTVVANTVFANRYSDDGKLDGYIVWAGNESYLCPWLTEWLSCTSSDSSESQSGTTESGKYKKRDYGITYNSSAVLTDQNRQLTNTINQTAKFTVNEKKLIIGIANDKEVFSSNGASGTPILTVDLASYIAGLNWCYGKILKLKDYLIVSIHTFPDSDAKAAFENPDVRSTPIMYLDDVILLVINTLTCQVDKFEVIYSDSTFKVNTIRGYTDFIVHNDSIYAVRSKTSPNIASFTGFTLEKDASMTKHKYVKGPKFAHKFNGYEFEVVELVLGTSVEVIVIGDVVPTPVPSEDGGKFGITGGVMIYTGAKLAASDLNKFTFYVQLYYALIVQMPYNFYSGVYSYPYWETTLGRLCRTDVDFYDRYCAQTTGSHTITELYGNTLIGNVTPSCGSIAIIVGQLYIEVITTKDTSVYTVVSSNTIYELTGEQQPVYTAIGSKWELLKTNGSVEYAYALNIFILWHLLSNKLSTGGPKSAYIAATLATTITEALHPIYLQIVDATGGPDLSETQRDSNFSSDYQKILYQYYKAAYDNPLSLTNYTWLYGDEIKYGNFPFPYDKGFTYLGGNRGEMSSSREFSGYNSCRETFLVTYTETKKGFGAVTAETPRPVLVIAGIGYYVADWGAKGWETQSTESPIVVEVYNYEAANGIKLSNFSKVNDSGFPTVYMQGNHNVFGRIIDYATKVDQSDPNNEYLHGMTPLPINGIYVNVDKQVVSMRCVKLADMRVNKTNLRQIYYPTFTYQYEYNTVTNTVLMNNYYLDTTAYEIKTKDNKLDLYMAKTISYWWSRQTPATSSDPIPWWGPCQLDMHITI